MDSFPARLSGLIVLACLIVLMSAALYASENASEAKLTKLKEEGNKKAQKALNMLETSVRLGNCLKMGIILFDVLLEVLVFGVIKNCSVNFSEKIYSDIVLLFGLLIFSFIIGLLGIFFPKRIARKDPEKVVMKLIWLIGIFKAVFSPFEKLSYIITSVLLKPFGVNSSYSQEEEVTEEDIRLMVDIGSESGAIDPDEKEMIHNIFELDDTAIKDIMTHRTDIELLWKEDGIALWEETISSTNHSIYPVCGESVDDVLGIIKAIDFYKLIKNDKSGTPDISSILRDPYLVPESIKADDLFRQMQKSKNHFAIVLDEYGGLAGIATMSDLLEEIVGDLDNDAEAEDEEEITELGENKWKILGSTDIELVCETLGVDLPVDEFNTFAGMILSELGEIPENGSTVDLKAHGLDIKVTKISEHRIDETIVSKIPDEKKGDE